MSNALRSPVHALTDDEINDAIELHGSINKACEALGMPSGSFKRRVRAMKEQKFREMQPRAAEEMSAPKKGVRRWIFSSAQCNTAVDEPFLRNLERYAEHVGASIHISGFTYNVNPYGSQKKKEPLEYHPSIRQYLTNAPFEIKDKLVFCGEMDTLPTATNPLSGFATYTRQKWGIVPHPKFVLESVPVRMSDDPKIMMTTGAVTKPNYVPRKAGIKAQFHHVIGAVLVEVDADGDFFVRQIVADDDGSFYDLDTFVDEQLVTEGNPVQTITWGDIHYEYMDEKVFQGCWGVDGDAMVDTLRPSFQIFHDVLDFRRRNHHSIKDPHHWYKMHTEGRDSIEDEVADCVRFLVSSYRPFAESFVIDSNHDRALEKWLKNVDPRYDPPNAEFYYTAQAAYYKSLRLRSDDFLLFEWACNRQGFEPGVEIEFIKNSESLMLNGIEYGMHGDKGANGARGHIRSFAKMGPKANVAHTHHAAVYEGIYQAGHSCKRDVEYNRGGLTSWNQSHILTYANGKRTIVTMRGSKLRAR